MEDLGLDDILGESVEELSKETEIAEILKENDAFKAEKSIEDKMIEKYISVDREVSEENLTNVFAKQMLAYDLEIKEIKEAQKEIKSQAKSEGIAIKQVMAALTMMKKAATANPLDKEEEEFLVEKFSEDVDIGVLIHQLTAKD